MLAASDAEAITPPFVTRPDPASAPDTVLALPRGSGSYGKTGAARFAVHTRSSGKYHVWCRVRWRDSCGNSLGLQLDSLPRRTVGQDSVYKRWHWIRAGRCELRKGHHSLLVAEREDGVELDQILFTSDADFVPSGRLLSEASTADLRCFADDFTRSAGRGLMFWKVLSGKWEIAFTLDPNRIPYQYALVGQRRPGDGNAVVLVDERSWNGCRFAFSVLPTAAGSFGAVLDRTPDGSAALDVGVETGKGSTKLIVCSPDVKATADLRDIVEIGQWHRVVLERWAHTLRVLVDDREVFSKSDMKLASGSIGLTATDTKTVFDDINVDEICWQTNAAGIAVHRELDRTDEFAIGPYHFTRAGIEDPSDFLDFTPEEYRKIRSSPEADRLRRRKRFRRLVGHGDKVLWKQKSGNWRVGAGILVGTGPNAVLRFSRELISPLELKLKVRLPTSDTIVELGLYAGPKNGMRVRLDPGLENPRTTKDSIAIPIAAGPNWHDLTIRATDTSLQVDMGGRTHSAPASQSHGGGILLKVPAGAAGFDDIEFSVPRRDRAGAIYAFDRRETGLKREGKGWTDHAGIACVIASNWTSLVAPDGRGALWTKSPVGSNLVVAVDISENTEWFGWTRGHRHHPADNICVFLSPGHHADRGYRLEVNSKNRSRTALYRNGIEVASVLQDTSFPIRYVGGHSPYSPRSSRISLVKDGGNLHAIINGKSILEFTDAAPLAVTHAGIGGYNTRVNFSHLEVRSLQATTVPDPVEP